MSDVSAVLSLPYLLPAQAQKHVTHNEALGRLDVAVQLAVIARDVTTPPASPAQGDRYLVPAGASGDWAGHDGDIAVSDLGTWVFQTPVAGWQARVLSEDALIRFDGTVWQDGLGALSADTLGVGGAADATNRLTSVAPATLLTHEGAGHQLKINKAAESDTASLLFQTDWSGRAEMGTTGTGAFTIKLSDDGSTWTTALLFDGASGTASGAAVQMTPDDIGTGKLARADYVYGPGNLLGPVSQTNGIPTGAVIERGSNDNGDYVRFADGTMICWSPSLGVDVTLQAGAIYRSTRETWVFPIAFVGSPAMMQGRQNHSTAYWTVSGVTTSTTGEACAMSYQSITNRVINLVAIGRWI